LSTRWKEQNVIHNELYMQFSFSGKGNIKRMVFLLGR
jgi:hypothetical protein